MTRSGGSQRLWLRYNASVIYGTVLVVHIAGALGTALFALLASLTPRRHPLLQGERALHVLILAATAQILTGSALAILSADIGALSLCDNLALYLTALCLAAFFISRRAQVLAYAPLRIPGGMLSLSIAVFVGALIAGV